MTVFVVSKNGKVMDEVFTSLKMACERFGLNYSSFSKGKRVFVDDNNDVTSVIEANVIKIKGRDSNYKRNKTDI